MTEENGFQLRLEFKVQPEVNSKEFRKTINSSIVSITEQFLKRGTILTNLTMISWSLVISGFVGIIVYHFMTSIIWYDIWNYVSFHEAWFTPFKYFAWILLITLWTTVGIGIIFSVFSTFYFWKHRKALRMISKLRWIKLEAPKSKRPSAEKYHTEQFIAWKKEE